MVRGIISPPRSRSSFNEDTPNKKNNNNNATTNPPSMPNYMAPLRCPATPVNEPPNHRKPTRPTTGPRQAVTNSYRPKPIPLRRTTAAPNPKTKPSSPRPARGKGAVGSGFDSENGGSGHGLNGHVGNPDRTYSDGHHHYGAFTDLVVRDKLHQLSLDDKDLANLVLHANAIYESLNSNTKEEECSSQSNNNNAPRILQIYKEIASHRQGNSSITSYITKLNKLWDELATFIDVPQCSCGSIEKSSEQMEREKVMQFVVGLHDSYSTFCAEILVMKPFPTVEKACSVIIREEKRRELVMSLEKFAGKVIENNWLVHNGNSNNNVDNDGIKEKRVDQNEVASFPVEPIAD